MGSRTRVTYPLTSLTQATASINSPTNAPHSLEGQKSIQSQMLQYISRTFPLSSSFHLNAPLPCNRTTDALSTYWDLISSPSTTPICSSSPSGVNQAEIDIDVNDSSSPWRFLFPPHSSLTNSVSRLWKYLPIWTPVPQWDEYSEPDHFNPPTFEPIKLIDYDLESTAKKENTDTEYLPPAIPKDMWDLWIPGYEHPNLRDYGEALELFWGRSRGLDEEEGGVGDGKFSSEASIGGEEDNVGWAVY